MPSYSSSKIDDLYSAALRRTQAERHRLERQWFRACLYMIGIQWIVYNYLDRRWQPRNLKPWVPRPVTNKFAMTANTIVQVLSSKSPITTPIPGSDDPEDVAAAEAAAEYLDTILEEARAKDARRMGAAWKVLTGNVILHPCWETSREYGLSSIPLYDCPKCDLRYPEDQLSETEAFSPAAEMQDRASACPKCGTPVTPSSDEQGNPATEDIPHGRVKIEVLSPFEVYCDMQLRSIHDAQELLIRRRYTLEAAREQWPAADGDEIQADPPGQHDVGVGVSLLRSIAYAAAYPGETTTGSAREDDELGVTIDFLWKKPSKDYPNGLRAVYANNKLRNPVSVEIPYHDRHGRPLWPFHHGVLDLVPGRLWGKTPMDDVAPKQEQRNKLESLIQLIIMRSANPVWILPKGSGVVNLTGEPGQVVDYNAMTATTKPERVPGENVPTSLMTWLEKIDSDIESLAGTFDVLRGNAPGNVTAGTALRLLLERAVTRYTPAIERDEEQWADVVKDVLMIFQEYADEPRVKKIKTQGGSWEFKAFKNSDIQGSVDIKVEAGSALPKNSVGTQALIQDLAAMGVILPHEPNTQYKILEEFGMTKLLGPVDDAIKQAQREEWRFFAQRIPPRINTIIDNHLVHLQSHKMRALKPDFEDLDDVMKAVWLDHIAETEGLIQMLMTPPRAENPREKNSERKQKRAEPGSQEQAQEGAHEKQSYIGR